MPDTDTLTRPDHRSDVQLHTGRNNADITHIVDQRKYSLADAYVFGTPVTALCGYEWIPTKPANPKQVCAACIAVASERGGTLAI